MDAEGFFVSIIRVIRVHQWISVIFFSPRIHTDITDGFFLNAEVADGR